LSPKNESIPKKNEEKSEFSLCDFREKAFFESRNPTERKTEKWRKWRDDSASPWKFPSSVERKILVVDKLDWSSEQPNKFCRNMSDW
jgi:hypothetical protein